MPFSTSNLVVSLREELRPCTCNQQRLQSLIDHVSQLGLGHVKYGFGAIADFNRKGIPFEYLTNYNAAWETEYEQSGFSTIDPTVHHCLTSDQPLWYSVLEQQYASDAMSTQVKSHHQRASIAGLDNGICFPLVTQSSIFRGGISLIGDCSLPSSVFEKEISPALHILWQLISTFHEALDLPSIYFAGVGLSKRERECLELAMQGYRNAEISGLLEVSDRTVEKFFERAKRKMRASSTNEAVAKLVVLEML